MRSAYRATLAEDKSSFNIGIRLVRNAVSGTDGLAGSVRDIPAELSDSTAVSDNVFHVFQDDTSSAKKDMLNWLKEIKD